MLVNLKSSDFSIVNGVPVLNFKKSPLKMVLIMKKTCFYCVQFAPVYKEISESIGKDLPVLQIEAGDISPELSKALNFKGYPTIKFFDKDGKMISEYSGPRSKSDILNTICKMYHHNFCGK